MDEWERWRGQFASLPGADAFPRATRQDLYAAWHGEAPIFRDFDDSTQLVQLVRESALRGRFSFEGQKRGGMSCKVGTRVAAVG